MSRQQPVFLKDACGRETPFHLEFICSVEAFTSVLASNFELLGAADSIRRGDFAIEDIATKQDVDLRQE